MRVRDRKLPEYRELDNPEGSLVGAILLAIVVGAVLFLAIVLVVKVLSHFFS